MLHQHQNERGLLVFRFGEITSGQRRQNTLNFLLAHPRHFYSSKTVVVKYEMTLLVIFWYKTDMKKRQFEFPKLKWKADTFEADSCLLGRWAWSRSRLVIRHFIAAWNVSKTKYCHGRSRRRMLKRDILQEVKPKRAFFAEVSVKCNIALLK